MGSRVRKLSEIGKPFWLSYEVGSSSLRPQRIEYTFEGRRELVSEAIKNWEAYKCRSLGKLSGSMAELDKFIEEQGL